MHNLISALKELIILAGEIAINAKHSGITVEYKYDNSPVTNADYAVSEVICASLKVLTPDIAVICEEKPFDINLTSNTFWLVDPIDGTKSFIKNENTYTINIGLINNGIPSIGFIYQPETKKLYYTDENKNLKIEKNGKSIDLVFPTKKDEYIAVIGTTYFNRAIKTLLQNNVISKVLTLSSSIKLCLIAECKADIYPRFGRTMEWDTAAGHALILATGGNILDANGRPLTYGKANFINPNFCALSRNWIAKYNDTNLPQML